MLENYLTILFLLLGIIGVCIFGYKYVRPKMMHWGATESEICREMSGDDLIANPAFTTTRVIEIKTRPFIVWSWLAQMGQGRGGFYSYTWIENLAGLDIQNINKIDSELQDIKVGDTIPFWKDKGVEIVEIESCRLLVLAGTLYNQEQEKTTKGSPGGTWVFELEQAGPENTRLIIRSRVAKFEPMWLSVLMYRLMLEPIHYVMERGMLAGIKKRSEMIGNNEN